MKRTITRILLSALLTMGMSAQAFAQSAYFSYQGKRLPDGATITINAEEDEWGDYSCESNPASNAINGLLLVNTTGKALSGKATLTVTKDTMKPYRVQWCMGGTCMIVNSNPFTKDYTVPANSFIMTQYDVLPDETFGTYEATIQAKAGSETFTVNIICAFADPSSVSAAAVRQPVPVEYFTLDGRSCKLHQPSGVSLARFSDGKVRKVTRKN